MKKYILLSCLTASLCQADTTLTYVSDGGNVQSMIQMTAGKLHMKTMTEENVSVIYDVNQETFITVMHDQQKYMRFGPKEIEALGDVSAMVMAQVEKQLAGMPAGQREQMREMMTGMIQQQMPKQIPAPSYKKTGIEKSFNGFDCEVIVKTSQNNSDDSFCVTEYSDLGISSAEYDSIAHFMKIAEKLASQFGQDQSMNFSSLGQYVPVQFDMTDNSGVLKTVSHEQIDANVFTVPGNYTEQSMGLEALQ